MMRRFKATITAARRRAVIRKIHAAYAAMEAVMPELEYFDRMQLSEGLSGLSRAVGGLTKAACTECDHNGYYPSADGFSATSCQHEAVPRYTAREGVA